MSLEQWEEVFAGNLTAPFLLSAWAFKLMKAHGWGRIINISSRAGRMYSDMAGAHYTAAKTALIGCSRESWPAKALPSTSLRTASLRGQ
jgi:3-oxoacyl-[acyl-carrier protein] reductase